MRVIAGVAGGRRLEAPPGLATRPTAERTREALFSTLESLARGLGGRRVLDLYAGTGAVGLEALSRGAALATMVESDPRTVAVLRRNVAALDLPGADVRASDVDRVLAAPPPEAYDIAFLDPPYAQDVTAVLDALVTGGWLRPGGLLAVERSSRDAALRWPAQVEALRDKRYGEAVLWYGRRAVGGESL